VNLRALIVDDELSGRVAVRQHCRAHPDLRIIGECASGEEALQRIRSERPDLAFLDVNMRPMTGIALAAKLQPEEVPMIVFVTAYDRYAVQAFELNAVDYLLKPFDPGRFHDTMERVRARVGQTLTPSLRGEMSRAVASVSDFVDSNRPLPDQERLVLEVDGRVYFVDPTDVESVEVEGNYSRIQTSDREYRVRCPIAELGVRLAEPRFLRISRQAIVNTGRIASMERGFNGEYHIVMNHGRQFTSARSCAQNIAAVLLRSRGPAD
jgi:two-component system LytT family response regulator